jgi:catechol 2,3-dioxygenase-like lactoylglutathione lyase family enzyme
VSITKAIDVSHVRFRAPDLPRMRSFLEDFGMKHAGGLDGTLYMRGNGTAPFMHVTEPGEPGFVGFGLWVPSLADLERLAERDGGTVKASAAPGGGHVLRIRDPDGYIVEVRAGQSPAEPLPVPSVVPWNQGGQYPRKGAFRRVPPQPSTVLRLGHVVVAVKSFKHSEQWYKERFGLLTSDEIRPGGEQDSPIGAFLRCDRGDDPCDHHTLFLVEAEGAPRFIHSAFEVSDLDDLMRGHEYLKARGHDHFWGVGRHLLGSQVFDYWKDPWGNEIEHWTDGDKLPAEQKGGFGTLGDLLGVQWGDPMPIPDEALADR